MVMRANIMLLRGQGFSQHEAANRLSVERGVLSKWENRFRKEALAGLDERRRSGRPPLVAQSTKASILDVAVRPPKRLSRWSTRAMAKARGVSNDKDFEPKFWDVIGLYLNPPDYGLHPARYAHAFAFRFSRRSTISTAVSFSIIKAVTLSARIPLTPRAFPLPSPPWPSADGLFRGPVRG
jgi:transposase